MLTRVRAYLGRRRATLTPVLNLMLFAVAIWVVNRVLRLLGARDELRVHNHHNFAWWEQHDGENWLVVRKGATPAFPGQLGFVGGSMGDDAVIIRGKESAASQRALYSTCMAQDA